MLSPEQTAALITGQGSITPDLPLVLRRAREGQPMTDVTLADIRAGLAVLKAAIRMAEHDMAQLST